MNDFPREPHEEPVDPESDPIEPGAVAVDREPSRSATQPRRWAGWATGVAVAAVVVGGFVGAKAVTGKSSATATTGASTPAAGSATAAQVIPFQRGVPGASKVIGQVPASFSAGTGTIITGTAANKAKTVAAAAYPGGTINRVVLLSSGDYNVHMIGVNWPHHIFVNKDFKVVGAE
jgi:hypothetical protein